MPRKPPAPTLAELQQMATNYAQDVLRRVAFDVGPLDDDAFRDAMHKIVQQLISAWAAGYAEGTKRS